ncbi:MAG: ABC transporter permease [Deltaproteobacteria bacterium]|nr:ABC transporter permease [Deltaproteobacteria bacterium]
MTAATPAIGQRTRLRRAIAFTRFELADSLRSRWLGSSLALYALVFVIFVALGLRESSILGFTGISRVVLNVTNGVLVAVPLLVLLATCQVVVRARRNGLLEMTLAQPVRRSEWFVGVLASRAAVLIGPLVVMCLGAALIGAASGGEQGLAAITARCLAVSTALAWAFLGIGLFISAVAKTAERAVVFALVVWVSATALHDFALIGLLLNVRLPPRAVFALAALNPSEAARIGILTGVDAELSVLGPVGFWIANALGATKALLVAVAWPLTLGTLGVVAAARNVRRGDAIG